MTLLFIRIFFLIISGVIGYQIGAINDNPMVGVGAAAGQQARPSPYLAAVGRPTQAGAPAPSAGGPGAPTGMRTGVIQSQGGGAGVAARSQPPLPAAAAAPGSSSGAAAAWASEVLRASPEEQRNMLGEKLYPLISGVQPDRAGKITGMLLEIDTPDLLALLDSKAALMAKVNEAVGVLEDHARSAAAGQRRQ